MVKRLAKNLTTLSGVTAASTSFRVCVATLTQAHATVDGKNAENLQSEDT